MKNKTLLKEVNLGFFNTELKELVETDEGVEGRHIKIDHFMNVTFKKKFIPKKQIANKNVGGLLEYGR